MTKDTFIYDKKTYQNWVIWLELWPSSTNYVSLSISLTSSLSWNLIETVYIRSVQHFLLRLSGLNQNKYVEYAYQAYLQKNFAMFLILKFIWNIVYQGWTRINCVA